MKLKQYDKNSFKIDNYFLIIIIIFLSFFTPYTLQADKIEAHQDSHGTSTQGDTLTTPTPTSQQQDNNNDQKPEASATPNTPDQQDHSENKQPQQKHIPLKIELVQVGDPGNYHDIKEVSSFRLLQDPQKIYFGTVNDIFYIGKYDITMSQYIAMLNAVATKSDPYHLYVDEMDPEHPIFHFLTNTYYQNMTGNIKRSGEPGHYHYSLRYPWIKVKGRFRKLDGSKLPITHVTWFMAARFCNWCHNGCLVGEEGPNTTESGAYNLNGAMADDANILSLDRHHYGDVFPGARCSLPTRNQMHKAAFYKGSKEIAKEKLGNDYWRYYNYLPITLNDNAPIVTGESSNPDGSSPTFMTVSPTLLANTINNGPFAYNRSHNVNYLVRSNFHYIYGNPKEKKEDYKMLFSNYKYTMHWDHHYTNGGHWDYRYANGGYYPGTTPVGFYPNKGTYGTYDIGGDVCQWLTDPSDNHRGVFGMAWNQGLPDMGELIYELDGNGENILENDSGNEVFSYQDDSGKTIFYFKDAFNKTVPIQLDQTHSRTLKGPNGISLFHYRLSMDHKNISNEAPNFSSESIGFRIVVPKDAIEEKDDSFQNTHYYLKINNKL